MEPGGCEFGSHSQIYLLNNLKKLHNGPASQSEPTGEDGAHGGDPSTCMHGQRQRSSPEKPEHRLPLLSFPDQHGRGDRAAA